MKAYDPRKLRCPYCTAAVGAWCIVGRRKPRTVEGFIHSRRYKASSYNRRRARVPVNQLRIFQ